jgi:dTDP-4-dehydrorhamnose reductase
MTGILLLGKYGQLGWELHRSLAPFGGLTALDYPEIDLVNPNGLDEIIQDLKPGVIINATAYTAVDKAEDEVDFTMGINAYAPQRMAELALKYGSALIHYSTDYVFDGRKGRPYLESDLPNPLGMYGKSKLAGETAIREIDCAHLIFRTSWVYSTRRDSFVTKVLKWAREQKELKIVDDQVSNPTWCRMLAEATAILVTKAGDHPAEWIREKKGLYHLAGDGYASRLEWAKSILEFDPGPGQQIYEELKPAQSSDYPSQAERPLFSALNCDKFADTFHFRLPDWREALGLAMESG